MTRLGPPVATTPGPKSEPYSPCLECRGLYVEDIVSGEMLMDTSNFVDGLLFMWYHTPKEKGYPPERQVRAWK